MMENDSLERLGEDRRRYQIAQDGGLGGRRRPSACPTKLVFLP